MGKGALAPSGNVLECFYALVVTAERSVDELFIHYFTICRLLVGALTPDPHRGSISGLPQCLQRLGLGAPWLILFARILGC